MAENDQVEAGEQEAAATTNTEGSKFGIQRIYVKDSSFEAPDSPECFRKQYSPQVNFTINAKSEKVEEGIYEVVLRLTADVKQDDKTMFLAEVQQAGIFEIRGIDEQGMGQVLNITCPSVLFPYGREAIDSLIVKGSFPALMLAPVNFEAVYAQALQNQASQGEAAPEAAPESH